MSDSTEYHELCAYTLSHGGLEFIHQHVVDAYAAQYAKPGGKPIGIFFALVGLYLHIEQGFTGKHVQKAHMKLASRRREWPVIGLPSERGDITPSDVMAALPGPARDEMIHRWAASVWTAYKDQTQKIVAELVRAEIISEV